MWCLFCFALARSPASPAPPQIPYRPHKGFPDLLWNLTLLWWTEQDVSLSILQTAVFPRPLNTCFGMHFSHNLTEVQHTSVMAWKTCLFLCWVLKCIIPAGLMASKGSENLALSEQEQSLHTTSVLSAAIGQGYNLPFPFCLEKLSPAFISWQV